MENTEIKYTPEQLASLSASEIPDELFELLDDSEKDSEFVAMESKTYFQDAWSRFKKNKLALIGHTSTEQLREYQDVPLDDLRKIIDAL